MNRTARRETKCRQAVHKVNNFLPFKRYWPSGILVHRQNSFAPLSRRRTGRREAQSHDPVNEVKPPYIYIYIYIYTYVHVLWENIFENC
jgi:hypothetical protein